MTIINCEDCKEYAKANDLYFCEINKISEINIYLLEALKEAKTVLVGLDFNPTGKTMQKIKQAIKKAEAQ